MSKNRSSNVSRTVTERKNSMFTNKRWNTILGGFVVVVVILGITGVLTAAPENQEGTDYPNKVYLPIVSNDTGSVDNSTPTPVSEEIEDWLVYEDEFVKGFRVKYPPTWFAGYGGVSSYDPSPESRDWKQFVPTKDTVKMLLYWEEDQALVSVMTSVQASSLTTSSYPKEQYSTVLEVQSATFGSQTAVATVQRDDSPMSQGNRKYRLYHFSHDDKVLTVLVEPINTNHEDTISKILSSLEFLD